MNEILERIDSTVKQYQEAISMHFEDGVPRWERYNVTRKIAQAACNIVARDAGQLLPRHAYGETLFSESYI